MEKYSEQILELRKILHLTQKEFAFPLWLKGASLSNIERGKQELSPDKLALLSEFYQVNQEWLLNGTGSVFINGADKNEIKKKSLEYYSRFVEWVGECPENSYPGFGSRLAKLRTEKGLKQSEFAGMTEISTVQLSRMENEKQEPDLRWLYRICEQFQINVRWLYQGMGSMYEADERRIKRSENVLRDEPALAAIIEKFTDLPSEIRQALTASWDEQLERARAEFYELQKADRPRVYRLYLELNLKWLDEKDIAFLKKYNGGERIAREILIPEDMTFHALHYAIMRLFGWKNGHLHTFRFTDGDFERLTDGGRYEEWKKKAGTLFRVPTDDEGYFWDDDYDKMRSGTIAAWLRKKYRGPYYYDSDVESQEYADDFIVHAERLMDQMGTAAVPDFIADLSQRHTLKGKVIDLRNRENLTVEELEFAIAFDGRFNSIRESLLIAEVLGAQSARSEGSGKWGCEKNRQPVCSTVIYQYDFGDNWEVKIEARGVVNEEEAAAKPDLKAAYDKVLKTHGPVCTLAVGKNVMDDVGGIGGYLDFLQTIKKPVHKIGQQRDQDDLKAWASDCGWKDVVPQASRIL